MQIKTIEKVIKSKMKEWLLTITDKHLAKEVAENLLVSGGSIASMLMGMSVNDYDVYLMNIDTVKKLAEYYTKDYKSEIEILDGRKKHSLIGKRIDITKNNALAISLRNLKDNQIKLFFTERTGGIRVNENKPKEELNYTPVYFSPNAISLSNDLQIVLRFWGTPAEIHSTFDFVHATNYFTFKEGLVRNLPAIESILTRQLMYQGSYYPLTSIIRAKKFMKRGFNIHAGEYLKIMFQISQLDLTNPDTLEEQLIGIDVAYFEVIIRALRNEYTNNPDFKPHNEWFNQLIDRVFDSNEDEETLTETDV